MLNSSNGVQVIPDASDPTLKKYCLFLIVVTRRDLFFKQFKGPFVLFVKIREDPSDFSLTRIRLLAMLRGLLIVLPPDDAQSAVANVAAAIAPGGAIYVVGWILDKSRVSPEDMATFNLHFINSLEHGSLYTEGEISTWLADAGFTEIVREQASRAYGSGFVMGRKR